MICGIFCAILFHVQLKKGIECYPSGKIQLIVREELLFFGIFLLWTYLAGFRPQAYGTEKFMDYGFMEAMMRSAGMPMASIVSLALKKPSSTCGTARKMIVPSSIKALA